ncbi:YceD family protein [Chryseolinea sp. T2]|uniref:YceD family protein n=1 Tax=Chryseolinea sp. T2 TaxID=3129255 RepID=UPI0030770AF1
MFEEFGTDIVSDGSFTVDVSLDKHETFLEADFTIRGTARLICDRSLEPFDFPINTRRKVVFKYGDQDEEITDEIMIIQRDTAWIELGQYLYEFIALAIPLKKLHPRFQESVEDDDSEGRIVYTSGGEDDGGNDESGNNDEGGDDDIDPRWSALKKLK